MLPYQEASDPPVDSELRRACAEEMHVITASGHIHRGDRSVLYVYEQLGWPVWPLRLPPFRWLTPPLYSLVANNRRWFARFFFRSEG